MKVTWTEDWSTLSAFCKGDTKRVQPYWKLATAIMLRTLKKRISQRLSNKDELDACRVELSAMLKPPIGIPREGADRRSQRPVFPTSGKLPGAQRHAPGISRKSQKPYAGGRSSSSCLWNGITPGTTHLFHISSILLWK